MKFFKLPIYALAAALIATPTLANASWWDDDEEEPFDEAFLFFELNDTDGDLGIHGKIDGGPWKKMEIEGPNERTLLKARARGRLARQGMTELFFESAEPCFDPEDCDDALDPEDFFNRFPEGEYEFEGLTLDYKELESEIYLSHIIPAAPDEVEVNGNSVLDDECVPGITPPVILSWDAVDSSHEELGETGDVDVRYYEVVIEIDESDFKSTAIIPPGDSDRVSWTLPTDFFALTGGDEYKFEILVRTNVIDDEGELVMVEFDGENGTLPGNKSAMESCFEI